MKKFALALLFVVFSLTQLSAQEPTFSKGDKVVNFGLGLGSIYYSAYGYSGLVPPLSASFEVGIVDNVIDKGVIGVGGYMAFLSYNYQGDWKTSDFVIGARGNFHYPLANKLDTYTGIMLGYDFVTYTDLSGYTGPYTGSSTRFVGAWFIGGRYYFSDTFAAMAEIGYGVTYLNLGVSLKF